MRARWTTSFSMGICISRKNALDLDYNDLIIITLHISTISLILR